MGQQQLLLLVLTIVLVGLAVVIGINAFGENNIKSNADAMLNDALRMASDIQAWAIKPELVGGGGDLSALNSTAYLNDVGYEIGTGGCAASEYGNLNGCYELGSGSGGLCGADPIPPVDGGEDLFILGRNENTGNRVCVLISGTKAANIGTAVLYGT